MVSVCLPSDALSPHLPSCLGFSYLGRGVSLHCCSSKTQPLLLTLDEVAPPDLELGVAPFGPPVPSAAAPWTWGWSSRLPPLTSDVGLKTLRLSRWAPLLNKGLPLCSCFVMCLPGQFISKRQHGRVLSWPWVWQRLLIHESKCENQNSELLFIQWKSLSRVPLFATLWTIQSTKFSRPEYWSG